LSIKSNNRALGAKGEEIAVNLLKERGLSILQQNFRCRHGEIDIIAKENGIIIFIEVKTRKNDKYGTPEAAVDHRKQKRLRLVAAYYLTHHCHDSHPCRFDVVSILLDRNDEPVSVRIIENCL